MDRDEELARATEAMERKTAELNRCLSMMRATLDSTTDAIVVTNEAGRVTGSNERFARLWALPVATIDTTDHDTIVEANSRCFDDPLAFKAKIHAVYADARKESFDVLDLADGRKFELLTRVQWVAGQPAGRVWSYRDVSERRRSEDALRDETRVLEILNTTGLTLASKLDLQELVQTVTDAATALSGATFGAFFQRDGRSPERAFSLWALAGSSLEALAGFDRTHLMEKLASELASGRAVLCDDIALDPRFAPPPPAQGSPSPPLSVRSCIAVPVGSRSEELIGALLFGHSLPHGFTLRTQRIITGLAAQAKVAIEHARLYEAAQAVSSNRQDLLERERAARGEAERMGRMKDEFLASLSHELRTPLAAILGWTHVLRRGGRTPADIEKGITTIERNARMQAQLIDDLLDMSRITSGKLRLDMQALEPAPLVDAAVETMRPTAEAKGLVLDKRIDNLGGTISGDPGRIQQIVWNLLSNAIKFTPKGGRIEVALERDDSQVEIRVADSGIGIKSEFLAHVFDRFRQGDASATRSFGGLGLGLAIVRELVEMHGGTVEAKSPGESRGATFSVRLPLAAAPSVDAAPKAIAPVRAGGAPKADLSGLRILVVDDESDGRELIKRLLDDCGALVFSAGSAEEALSMLDRARPDLLVSDIGMPNVDGFEFLRRVRASGKATLPAIALTAFARAEDRDRALGAGFKAHLAKPVEPAELIAAVASATGRTAPSGM